MIWNDNRTSINTAWAMLATASAQVCVPLGHSSLILRCVISRYLCVLSPGCSC